MKVGIILLITIMLIFQPSQSAVTFNFLQGVILTNYNTLQSSIPYSIPITFDPTDIPATSNVLLQFSNHYLINTVTGCTYSIGGAAAIATTCNPTFSSSNQKYQINFPNIYPLTMNGQVGVTLTFTIDNPYLAIQEKIDIYLKTGATAVGSGTASVTYTASPLSGCSFTSSSDVTGVSSTRTISFTPSVRLKQDSVLVITLPAWFGSMRNEATGSLVCANITNSDSAFPICNAFSVDQDLITTAYYQSFNAYYLIATDKTLSQPISFTLESLKNPYSQQPFGPITFELKAYDNGVGTQLFTSQSCTNIYQTSSTLGAPTGLIAVLSSTLNISTPYSGRSARFRILNPFPSLGGQLSISYPSTVSLIHTSTLANTNSTIATTTSTTFTGLAVNDLTSVINITIGSLTITTPPSSRPFTLTFRTQVSTSGSVYGIQQSIQTYACQTGTLTSATLTTTSVSVNAINDYTLSFKTSNSLVSGSFIEVYFPSEITPTVGACTANLAGLACTVTNTSLATILISVSVSSNTTIQLIFTNVKNPKQALTTSSFRIFTYYDSGSDSIVDTITSGISLTSIPNPISTLIAAPTVTPGSFITFALTTYTFTATLSDFIPASGYISIGFPSTITFSSLALASASFGTGTCQINIVNITIVNINNCFGADMTSLNMSLTLSGILNPPSLQPTTSFSFATYGPLGQVNYISTGLSVTMQTPATSIAFSISPLSFVVHALTKYSLGFTFAVPHSANDYFDLSIPSSMAFSAPTCAQVSGFAGISCATVNTTSIRITITASPLLVSAMSIQNIRNYDIATSLSYSVTLYNSLGFAMQSTPSSIITYTPQTIAAPTINSNDQIALYENSNITITMSTPFAMHSSFLSALTSVSITVPSPDFTVTSNTTCSVLVGTCSTFNNTIKVSSVGLSLSSFTISISRLLLSYFLPTSNSLIISYEYNNTQVATLNTGAVLTVYCTSPCERCVSTRVACGSCLPSPNTFIYYFGVNSSCLLSCPPKYYNDTGYICTACKPPCSECLDSANCTKCTNTTYLFGFSCLSVCPGTFYGNSSNVCASCEEPCFNCTSSTACTSCAVNFYTNSTCVNASSCPAGTYGNVNSSACDPCTPPCSTCFSFSDNCTSCTGFLVFFQNKCLGSCPPAYYNSSKTCATCKAPCGNCTSDTNCLSCQTNFLSGTACVNASSCPNGTFADNATNTCATCPTSCSGCVSSSTCTSCKTSFIFYNNTCLSVCPDGTFKSGQNCLVCSTDCFTCTANMSRCTSCVSPKLLVSFACIGSCPNGTYSNGVTCVSCPLTCQTCTNGSSCTGCTGNLFFNNGSCTSNCPSGTFKDLSSNTCTACDPTCFTCSSSPSNCSACPTSSVYFSGTCIPSCPTNYFNISGKCKTCGYCLTCTTVSTCSQCLTGYYLFNSACYSICPSSSITDAFSMTCIPCDPTCRTCSGTTANCASCPGGMYLLNGVCLSSCPSGYVAEAGMCTESNLGNIAYFPFSITFLVFFIIVVYSKANHSKTEMVTTLCGFLGFLVWLSWMVLVFKSASTDHMLDGSSKSLILGMGITSIIFNIALGTIFAIWFRKNFTQDIGFAQWINHADKHLNVYKLIFTLTFVSFPSFRLMYSKLFNRTYFCMFMVKGANFLSATVKFTIVQIIFCLLPIIFVSAYVIYIKLQYDQTLINSIDSLLLNIILIILLIIDAASKDDNFFKQMLQDQPYLRKFKYNQLDNSLASLREFDENGKPRHKSELDQRDKEDFFRTKINFIDNLNKFGHLNFPVPELPGKGRKVKTLPDDLQKLPQFDMNQDEEIKVIDDDFFFEEQEKRRRMDDEERMRLQEEERLRRLKEQQQERERRRLKMLQDMDQQHSIEFPDLAAIEKVQNKGENLKKSPTHILNKFKKVEDRTISEKDKKKLEEVAKKNGLNEDFMTQTFSIQKHHNPQLLNSIIDKHNHVNREAVKALFNPDSNPELLQQLFSKNSTMSPQKLRKLMNDPQAATIIKNLANAQKGIVSPELAKILLDKNSKYSEQFVKQLLKINGENGEGIDPQKLKQILKDNPDKNQREAALKAMKKIGGDNLQNKQILENMLGTDSVLQADNFARVGNDLPKKVLESLFSQKSQRNNTIITKVLNNKKINLKSLTPILQDPQLLQQLAQALSNGNPDTEANLINLFKNGENLDPQLLKQLLRNPTLMQKLLSKPIDPAFLSNLLKKDAKTDLKLLEKAIQNMSDEQIGKVFEFNPEKNVDFQKVAKLFEANMKSDPKLISQFLTPEIIQNVYNKASNTKAEILNKLLEKGKQIDQDSIIRIYGDDNRIGGVNYNGANNNFGEKNGGHNNGDRVGGGNYRDNSRMGDEEGSKKYNITDNNFNPNKDDQDDELGYKKGMNQNAMSRTDGRMLGFLSPIQVGLQRNKKYSKNGLDPSNPNNRRRNGLGMDLDELGDEQMTQYSVGEQQKQAGEDEDEQVDEFGQRRKKRKLKKKPLDDIRLPSQQIYLQRLQAPHQKKRNIRKKKKKVSSSMQHLEAMDEDNQVYDLDF